MTCYFIRMIKFRVLLLFAFLCPLFGAKAQQIPCMILASDSMTKDSISKIVKEFQSELCKAIPIDFQLQSNPSLTNDAGFEFIIRTEAIKNNIVIPDLLKKFNAEGYFISSTHKKVIIVGNSALAIQAAVFDYLEKLGFRYFLPGETWQVIPFVKSPFVKYQMLTQPLFEFRSLANGHGFNRNNAVESDFNFWAKANRLGGAFPIRIGHAYQTIVSNNADTFKAHPEYFAGHVEKGVLPPTAKFNVSNNELVKLVINDANERLSVFKRTGQFMNMISMEPSDGGGFCTYPACKKIGSVSDQVFFLTNAVAKAIQQTYPGVWVGNLAYNEHILPTKYKLEPNVFVMVTNGFNRTKYTTNQLLSQWNKKAKKIGVYEYLSVYEWDNDLPGKSNAAHIDYLKKSIKGYYENGARVYLAETTMGWISKGLGQYVTSKLLWNYKLNVDSLVEDFYTKCFGAAAVKIRQLFTSWENYPGMFISDNALANWLELVSEADGLVEDILIKKRINDIKVYLHYLVLYKKLKTDPTIENLNTILSFSYRVFEKAAFSTFPTMISLPKYSGFKGYGYYDKKEHPWIKNTSPLSEKEINSTFNNDLLSVKRIEGLLEFNIATSFTTVKTPVLSPKMKAGIINPSFIGETSFIIKVTRKSDSNYLLIKSGYAARPEDAKPVVVKVFKYAQYRAVKDEADDLIGFEQVKKLETEKVSLKNLLPGDYLVKIDDQSKLFSIQFSSIIQYSLVMDAERMVQTSSVTGLNTFYFIVSPGSKRFVIHKTKTLKLISPAGRVLEYTENKQQNIVVEVLQNETGVWQIYYQTGSLQIEGISPYLGINPASMLIPSAF